MPSTLEALWTAIATFFTDGLSAAVTLITGSVILIAPLIIRLAGSTIGAAKGLFGLRRRRR